MKRWILVMMCAFLYVMPVNATQLSEEESSEVMETEEVVEESSVEESSAEVVEDEEETSSEVAPAETEEVVNSTEEIIPAVTEEETEESEAAQVEIPDVTGMTETDAVAALGAVVLSDGSSIEIIKEYAYSNDAEKDIVYGQSISGVVNEEEAKQITIQISLGKDPNETVVDGITEPLNQTISSAYGINWDSLPEYYDYNWDNSQNCWVNGVWIDGKKYITPEGTYNTNVRHKIQLYTDGTYVYTHIVFSRDYEAAANGNWFNYTIGGQTASFQVETFEGTQLANNNLAPGTYKVAVRHANGSVSGTEAYDSSAHYTVFDSQVNAHLEIKIPLSEMAVQNPNIDFKNGGTIEYFTPNLMSSKVTTSGASTFPFATAAAAFVLVPGSAYVINKKRKLTKKGSNEK